MGDWIGNGGGREGEYFVLVKDLAVRKERKTEAPAHYIRGRRVERPRMIDSVIPSHSPPNPFLPLVSCFSILEPDVTYCGCLHHTIGWRSRWSAALQRQDSFRCRTIGAETELLITLLPLLSQFPPLP